MTLRRSPKSCEEAGRNDPRHWYRQYYLKQGGRPLTTDLSQYVMCTFLDICIRVHKIEENVIYTFTHTHTHLCNLVMFENPHSINFGHLNMFYFILKQQIKIFYDHIWRKG